MSISASNAASLNTYLREFKNVTTYFGYDLELHIGFPADLLSVTNSLSHSNFPEQNVRNLCLAVVASATTLNRKLYRSIDGLYQSDLVQAVIYCQQNKLDLDAYFNLLFTAEAPKKLARLIQLLKERGIQDPAAYPESVRTFMKTSDADALDAFVHSMFINSAVTSVQDLDLLVQVGPEKRKDLLNALFNLHSCKVEITAEIKPLLLDRPNVFAYQRASEIKEMQEAKLFDVELFTWMLASPKPSVREYWTHLSLINTQKGQFKPGWEHLEYFAEVLARYEQRSSNYQALTTATKALVELVKSVDNAELLKQYVELLLASKANNPESLAQLILILAASKVLTQVAFREALIAVANKVAYPAAIEKFWKVVPQELVNLELFKAVIEVAKSNGGQGLQQFFDAVIWQIAEQNLQQGAVTKLDLTAATTGIFAAVEECKAAYQTADVRLDPALIACIENEPERFKSLVRVVKLLQEQGFPTDRILRDCTLGKYFKPDAVAALKLMEARRESYNEVDKSCYFLELVGKAEAPKAMAEVVDKLHASGLLAQQWVRAKLLERQSSFVGTGIWNKISEGLELAEFETLVDCKSPKDLTAAVDKIGRAHAKRALEAQQRGAAPVRTISDGSGAFKFFDASTSSAAAAKPAEQSTNNPFV